MKIVRMAVAGAGIMGSSHAKSARASNRVELTAVCDKNKEGAEKLAAELGAKAFFDADEMFKSGLVDAVIIATPHYFHTPLVVSALEHGIHALTDKPIAVHKADALKMTAAAAKRPDLKFAAMFNQRTIEFYKKIKSLIDAGELGELKRVSWTVTDWFRTQKYYNSGSWRATWKGEGGGVLLNQCPHQLDLFQWFFGMPSKVTAFCRLGCYHKIEVEDDVTAYFEFPNGASGVFTASTGEAPGTNRLEIAGDRGRLVVENSKILFNRTEIPVSEFCLTTENMWGTPPLWNAEIPVTMDSAGQHQKIIQNFADAILDGVPLTAPGSEGVKSVELANAMLYSSMKKQTVEFPLDAAAFETLLNELIEKSPKK
jgi:predicted dehydrogenase